MDLNNDSLQKQFDAAKSEVPVGWHWMLDILARQIHSRQNEWLKLEGLARWEKSDLPVFSFTLLQGKNKFGSLRIYSFIDQVDHGDRFDRDEYLLKFNRLNSEIHGCISTWEDMSQMICERSGERGAIRNINGWLTCLSDEEYAKIS